MTDTFPFQLTFNKNPERLIPGVDFAKRPQKLGNILTEEQKDYVAPTAFYNIFKVHAHNRKGGVQVAGRPKHELLATAAELCRVVCSNWLRGCGISRQILFEIGTNATPLNLSPQLRSFYLFHVNFTIRRILFEIGGIQSESAFLRDPTFSQTNSYYDITSYNRICKESISAAISAKQKWRKPWPRKGIYIYHRRRRHAHVPNIP